MPPPQQGTLRLFSILGIPVRISGWVLPMLGLVSLSAVLFPQAENNPAKLALGLLTLLFSVFCHELGHALLARWRKLPVADITLHLFYAATRTNAPRSPREELLVALGGPLLSLLLGGSLALAQVWIPPGEAGWHILLKDAMLVNLLLGAANLLPAFPMDGGRILRAFLQRSHSFKQATLRAVWTGRLLASLMLLAPFVLGFGALGLGLPLIALVVLVLGEQERARVCAN